MKTMLFVVAFALFAVPARAQSLDQRWEPWLGCWTLATENLRNADSQDAPQRSSRPSTVRDGAPRVCVSRAPDGARFETTVGAQSAIDQTIAADAVSRPVNDAECSGTQRAEWSRSGLRLFSSAEIRCKGDEGLRRVSGLSLIAPNGDWLDIQTVAVGPRETIRVKRYYRADDSPRSTRPTVVSSRLTLDEVKEAGSKVSSAALEAALVETNAGFDLSKKTVTDLASAGVSGRVIDLLVALSYPERFTIQPVGQAGGSPVVTTYARDPFLGSFGSPFYYDPFFYGSPYLYEPFGYRGSVFIDSGGGGGGSGNQSPGVARVINGQGYTRIVPRDTVPSTNTQTARTAGSRSTASDSGSSSSSSGSSSSGSSSSGSSSSSSGSSGGGGGGATVSPSGASSGGSSDSGRTAVPR